jgi:hypothetical protein
LLLLLVVGIYAAGWLTFQSNETTATIEIKTGEIKQAVEEASEKAEKVVEDAAKTIREPVPRTSESENPSRTESR